LDKEVNTYDTLSSIINVNETSGFFDIVLNSDIVSKRDKKEELKVRVFNLHITIKIFKLIRKFIILFKISKEDINSIVNKYRFIQIGI
jgi:uncharacterized protein YehS (DUF1456 family)